MKQSIYDGEFSCCKYKMARGELRREDYVQLVQAVAEFSEGPISFSGLLEKFNTARWSPVSLLGSMLIVILVVYVVYQAFRASWLLAGLVLLILRVLVRSPMGLIDAVFFKVEKSVIAEDAIYFFEHASEAQYAIEEISLEGLADSIGYSRDHFHFDEQTLKEPFFGFGERHLDQSVFSHHEIRGTFEFTKDGYSRGGVVSYGEIRSGVEKVRRESPCDYGSSDDSSIYSRDIDIYDYEEYKYVAERKLRYYLSESCRAALKKIVFSSTPKLKKPHCIKREDGSIEFESFCTNLDAHSRYIDHDLLLVDSENADSLVSVNKRVHNFIQPVERLFNALIVLFDHGFAVEHISSNNGTYLWILRNHYTVLPVLNIGDYVETFQCCRTQ